MNTRISITNYQYHTHLEISEVLGTQELRWGQDVFDFSQQQAVTAFRWGTSDGAKKMILRRLGILRRKQWRFPKIGIPIETILDITDIAMVHGSFPS